MKERLSRLSCLAALLCLGACASTTPQVDPTITSAVSSRGVNSGTYAKMSQGQVLDVTDIQNLVSKGVPTNIIVPYLESTRKVYNLSPGQLQTLKSSGASSQLLAYLDESQGFYGQTSPAYQARTSKKQKDAYYNSPYYQDEQPFAYNPPIIDDWYDSGYEESLYSPFSYN
jgi:hypothetical protein